MPVDKQAKIWAALKSHLDTITGYTIHYNLDAAITPDVTAPYIIVQDLRQEPERQYIGNGAGNYYRGSLEIGVMVPIDGWTYPQGLQYAAGFAAEFPEGLVMTYENMRLQVSKEPHILGVAYRDGAFSRYPVSVQWEGR